jgi:hypothetical protein
MSYPDRDGHVFFALARDRLAVQLEALDAIDNKIGVLFTTSTALLGILAAVLALKAGHISGWDYTAVGVSVVVYGFVSVYAGYAYRAREWKTGGDLRETWRMYSESEESDRQLEWRVANRLRLDYEANKGDVANKLDALDRIFPALVIQSLILVLTLVLVAAG